jgi:hypothetical protein
MNTEIIALRAAEAMRDEAAKVAVGDADLLRRQGQPHTADAYEYAARRIRAIDAGKLVDQVTNAQPNPDERAAFEAAARSANFNVQRRDSGELFHPITDRVHQVWRAAVSWVRETGIAAVGGKPDALYPGYVVPATAPVAQEGSAVEAWKHAANEWADTATNGLQWLRNIAEGVSDVKAAIENMEACVRHAQSISSALHLAAPSSTDASAQAAQADMRDAARWRAFLGSSRIRPLGSAGLNEPMPNNYAHLGLEMWTTGDWSDCPPDLAKRLAHENKVGIEWLTKYADIAIEAQKACTPADDSQPAVGGAA